MRTAVTVTPRAANTAAAAANPNETPVVGLFALLLLEPLAVPLEVVLDVVLEVVLDVVLEVVLDVVLEVVLEVVVELSPLVVPVEEVDVPPPALSPLAAESPEALSLPDLPVMPFTMSRPALAAPSTISSPALTAPFTAPPIAEPMPDAEAAEVSAAKHAAAAAAAEIFFIIVCSPLF